MAKKMTVSAMAKMVVEDHAENERQEAARMVESLKDYRALVTDLSGTDADKRPEEVLLAGRILGGRLGYSLDDDLRHLLAIQEAAAIESERGDLDAAMRALDEDLNGSGQAFEALTLRHQHERRELEVHFQRVGDDIQRLTRIARERDAAVAATRHLEVK